MVRPTPDIAITAATIAAAAWREPPPVAERTYVTHASTSGSGNVTRSTHPHRLASSDFRRSSVRRHAHSTQTTRANAITVTIRTARGTTSAPDVTTPRGGAA